MEGGGKEEYEDLLLKMHPSTSQIRVLFTVLLLTSGETIRGPKKPLIEEEFSRNC